MTNTVQFHLYQESKIVKFMNQRVEGWLTGGQGNEELLFIGYKVSVKQDE